MRTISPYEIYNPVEIPGWGQVQGLVIQDEITWARYVLETGGAAAAMSYLPTLEDGVKTKRFGWRTELAAELVLQIKRAAALLGQLEPHRQQAESVGETAGSFSFA